MCKYIFIKTLEYHWASLCVPCLMGFTILMPRFSTWNDDVNLMMSIFIVNPEAEKSVLMNKSVFKKMQLSEPVIWRKYCVHVFERVLCPCVWESTVSMCLREYCVHVFEQCFHFSMNRLISMQMRSLLSTERTNNIPAGTWRKYNVASMSMQHHDVASTLMRHYIYVMCPLGSDLVTKQIVPIFTKNCNDKH